MAKISMRLNSEVERDAENVVKALEEMADAIELFFAYLYGSPEIMEEQYRKFILTSGKCLCELSKFQDMFDNL